MSNEWIELTASIVASYVENNSISATELPGLIQTTYTALTGAGQRGEPTVEAQAKATPAQIRKSVTADAIVSFEDGRSYKSMKRHLALRGLTPADYREKWGLPTNYPMVSPAYSAARSAMAKSMGLGSGGRGAVPVAIPAAKVPKANKIPANREPAPSAKGNRGRTAKSIKPQDETFT